MTDCSTTCYDARGVQGCLSQNRTGLSGALPAMCVTSDGKQEKIKVVCTQKQVCGTPTSCAVWNTCAGSIGIKQ